MVAALHSHTNFSYECSGERSPLNSSLPQAPEASPTDLKKPKVQKLPPFPRQPQPTSSEQTRTLFQAAQSAMAPAKQKEPPDSLPKRRHNELKKPPVPKQPHKPAAVMPAPLSPPVRLRQLTQNRLQTLEDNEIYNDQISYRTSVIKRISLPVRAVSSVNENIYNFSSMELELLVRQIEAYKKTPAAIFVAQR